MIMEEIKNIQEPFFSIVVPAYNSACFIKKCIESVLEQSISDFELILVDDGSMDETLTICNAYARRDSRIRVFHKENGGHTSARNIGLMASLGTYILFLDSDDWLNPDTLKICAREITVNQADIVIFRIKNSTSIEPFPVLVNDGYYKIEESVFLMRDNILLGKDGKTIFPKSLSAKCFKRNVILDSQLSVPKEILIGEDGLAFVGAILKSKAISVVANDTGAGYNCLVREKSVSRTSDINAFERVAALLKHYEKMFSNIEVDFTRQFNRYIVEQLYTSALLVIRADGGRKELNKGLTNLLENAFIRKALKDAKFNLKGYKFIIKKYILRYRLWILARVLDRI